MNLKLLKRGDDTKPPLPPIAPPMPMYDMVQRLCIAAGKARADGKAVAKIGTTIARTTALDGSRLLRLRAALADMGYAITRVEHYPKDSAWQDVEVHIQRLS
ncbi:MAG: hypothetical protein WAX89_06055 [Alphaproteobacteria bacterium]